MNIEKHLDNLIRHIELVRDGCILIGKRLIAQGRIDFGRLLIARGHVHDASKFCGIEWRYLHQGNKITKNVAQAIQQHVETNSHHPEFRGGLENMEEIDVAEMVCDWYARSQEFGTGLRDWIKTNAVPKYKIDLEGDHYRWIVKFIDLLLEPAFEAR
jgi:hypothetical protein